MPFVAASTAVASFVIPATDIDFALTFKAIVALPLVVIGALNTTEFAASISNAPLISVSP